MSKHAATLVLVALALALGVWLWLDRDEATQGERKRRENNAFVAWRREELSKITIAHDGETIVLERDVVAKPDASEAAEGRWRMTSPYRERADAVAVDRLLMTLELATAVRKVSGGAAAGLDAPRVTGRVQMGGLDVAFALGAPSPRPEGSSYFRVDDAAPIVVSKEVTGALLASSDTYRDRTVVPYLATELSRFEVVHAGGSFTLERIDERSMRVAESGLLASRAAVERLWAALAEIRAEAFPRDADADRLTAQPAVTLKLTPKDSGKPPAELVIGQQCPGNPADVVVLRKAPSRAAACAPKDVIAALGLDPASLADRHPFSLRMDEIEEVRLERSGGEALELARKGEGFHERAPADRDLEPAEADAATELLTRIANSEARSVSRGGAPFTAVGRALVRRGDTEQIVELGAPGADGVAPIRRVIDDARLDVEPSVYRRLLPRQTSLRPRSILDGELRRPTRAVLRCGVEQELVDRGEGFRLVTPAGYETDGSVVRLVEALTRGRVDAWVADADDGSFGFSPDGCHVVIAFEDGNAPVTVWFGAEAEGGIYVRVDGRPGVAVAPRALRDLAKSTYVSRGSLRTQAARVEAVRVTLGGKPVPSRDADAEREAIAGLFADRVVSLEPLQGPPDLVLEVATSEGGPPRRIRCRSISPSERRCALDGLRATFSVPEAHFTALLPPRDAGAPRDGGGADPTADASTGAAP